MPLRRGVLLATAPFGILPVLFPRNKSSVLSTKGTGIGTDFSLIVSFTVFTGIQPRCMAEWLTECIFRIMIFRPWVFWSLNVSAIVNFNVRNSLLSTYITVLKSRRQNKNKDRKDPRIRREGSFINGLHLWVKLQMRMKSSPITPFWGPSLKKVLHHTELKELSK